MGNAVLPLIALGAIAIPLGIAGTFWNTAAVTTSAGNRRNNRGLSRHMQTEQ